MARCPASGLLTELRAQTQSNPALVLTCASRITDPRRRDPLLQSAFTAAARQSPALAKRHLNMVAAQPWIGDLPLPLALQLGDKRILEACVRAHPSIAIREAAALEPYGLVPLAIALTPGEALGIAAGSSGRAARLRELLPTNLQAILAREDLDLPLKQRLAWLTDVPPEQALAIARDDKLYFARIAAADGEAVPFAERWSLEAKQHGVAPRLAALRAWQPRDVFLLLVQGREQIDKPLFQTIFDNLLRTKLPATPSWPHLRRFVRDASVYGRINALPKEWILRTLDNPASYEDMLLAAEVAGVLQLTLDGSNHHPALAKAWLEQRHFFYDDDDGRESFASFRRTYRENGWTWTEQGGVVTLTKGAMRIEANVPGRELPLRGSPGVIVHRGHEFHVPKTLAVLPAATAFVFLGSCRGMGSVGEVLKLAPQADVLVTRATGSHTVNDPLLKALNEAALSGNLVWETFWDRQRERFRGNPLFDEYIPPHHNAAAYVIKAYQRYLSAEGAPPVDEIFSRWTREFASRSRTSQGK
ncbi:MAG: hypothetical protein JST93_00950 [Acidobacteria bacterium]|nr:hypothetical protein [Acidobacteriota bacterium]